MAPLRSLIEDQVTHLGNFGVPTIAIKDGKDSELVQH